MEIKSHKDVVEALNKIKAFEETLIGKRKNRPAEKSLEKLFNILYDNVETHQLKMEGHILRKLEMITPTIFQHDPSHCNTQMYVFSALVNDKDDPHGHVHRAYRNYYICKHCIYIISDLSHEVIKKGCQ
jgi:hypothetical protein